MEPDADAEQARLEEKGTRGYLKAHGEVRRAVATCAATSCRTARAFSGADEPYFPFAERD